MTDNQASQPVFNVRRVFLKDASFESPMGFLAFRQEWDPTFTQNINTRIEPVEDNLFECTLTITLTAQLGKEEEARTAFIIEVQQSGLFVSRNLEKKQEHFLLHTMAPNLLFPYLREVVDNLALKGGFPAPNIPPINFEAVFKQAQEQKQQANEASKH